jgi:hypothetical protein
MTKPTKWFMGMPFQAEGLNFRHFEKKETISDSPLSGEWYLRHHKARTS